VSILENQEKQLQHCSTKSDRYTVNIAYLCSDFQNRLEIARHHS